MIRQCSFYSAMCIGRFNIQLLYRVARQTYIYEELAVRCVCQVHVCLKDTRLLKHTYAVCPPCKANFSILNGAKQLPATYVLEAYHVVVVCDVNAILFHNDL